MYNYLAEFVGTLLVVYVYMATSSNPLAVGATISLIMLLSINITNIYLNPALTIASVSIGKLPSNELVPYCIAQIMGGLVGLEIFKRWVKR